MQNGGGGAVKVGLATVPGASRGDTTDGTGVKCVIRLGWLWVGLSHRWCLVTRWGDMPTALAVGWAVD